MDDPTFEALKNDIKQHGQRDSIKVYKNTILDGKNRDKACKELGLKSRYEILPDDTDIVAYVKSVGLHRRDLTSPQRIYIAMQLETYEKEKEGLTEKIEDIKKDPGQKIIYENAEIKRITRESNSNKPTVKKMMEIVEKAREDESIKKELESLLENKKTIDQVHKKVKPRAKKPANQPAMAFKSIEELSARIKSLKRELLEKKAEISTLEGIIKRMTEKFKELGAWESIRKEIYPIYEFKASNSGPTPRELREAMD
jgi:hypothetical protein